jgi:N-methylhydantoinase A
LATISGHLQTLTDRAKSELTREGIASERQQIRALLDMRYVGQAYELVVPFLGDEGQENAFHETHRRTYGHAMPERAVEVVNLRIQPVGVVEKPTFQQQNFADHRRAVPIQQRSDGVTLYNRDALQPGDLLDSPALVFQLDSTVFVAPNWNARVDTYGNLIVEKL